jgi:hypothetical protein
LPSKRSCLFFIVITFVGVLIPSPLVAVPM